MKNTFYLLVYLTIAGCNPKIVDKSVPFDEERKELSLEYLRERYGIVKDFPSITPKMVVVHWTAIPTFEGSYKAFYDNKLPSSRSGISGASSLNVGIHYLVDKEGEIFRLMPDTLFARHVIGLNHSAIGIENVGTGPLNEAQFKANKKLIKMLLQKHEIEYVIGHHEYKQFREHDLWMEKDPNYLTNKSDPGDEFMFRLRDELGFPRELILE